MERPFGRGITRSLRDLLTMVTNHLLTGMILQVGPTFCCSSLACLIVFLKFVSVIFQIGVGAAVAAIAAGKIHVPLHHFG